MTVKFILLFLLVMATATAVCQALFKKTLTAVGSVPSAPSDILSFVWKLALTPSFIAGLVLYVFAFVLWIYLLSRNQLSYIYPMGIALNVILTLAATKFLLGEAFSLTHLLGVGVILLGIFMIAY